VTATYRLIHLEPDPFSGARVALGAVVVDGRGAVRVARARRVPTVCLGDSSVQVLAARIHARLDTIGHADRLPMAFGPYVSLAPRASVPDGVVDPVGWVEAMLGPAEAGATAIHGVQRATLGFRFFETWRVADVVRKTFQPKRDGRPWLAAHAGGLSPVSHWVEGQDRLLLMEPLVPERRSFEKDLHEVAQRFGAYQHALRGAPDGWSAELVAYVLAGEDDARAHAREVLAPFAHEVIDTGEADSRDGLLRRIEEIGRGTMLQG
jgi:hypothetical protein